MMKIKLYAFARVRQNDPLECPYDYKLFFIEDNGNYGKCFNISSPNTLDYHGMMAWYTDSPAVVVRQRIEDLRFAWNKVANNKDNTFARIL